MLVLAALVGCGQDAPGEGQALTDAYGCTSCHEVPGLPGPQGHTGPPLTEMPLQAYIAGVLPNTPENLAAFIVDPQQVDPRSAMPDLGVTPEEAAAIATFLYEAGER